MPQDASARQVCGQRLRGYSAKVRVLVDPRTRDSKE